MSTKGAVILVRHGQSEANVLKIISCDPTVSVHQHGLTEVGRQQAKETASQLLKLIEEKYGENTTVHILTSDFKRARETACELLEIFKEGGLQPSLSLKEGLRERSFGRLNGESTDKYEEVWKLDAAQEGKDESLGQETTDRVQSRALKVLEDHQEQISACGGDSGSESRPSVTVLVAHGDVLQIVQTHFEGQPSFKHRFLQHIDTGGFRIVNGS
uniref:Phosphoglycerate mutase (2,3-diphosphoglycerate-dependent) n=1 Tax=Chromera velia CCMP2878 TaxID=1169474 RepID=A0A0G4FQI6_9ALVE|mmetsp:Transcript_49583/g.97675  ORF Transcript_49583/g.97675 Transcript_49583/m.97675 type:complete len:215 (-) Transcript_49583:79-723(-)|eukprot:Cvel_454.t1-p1 / transcript=Cvel_454.t1 / gene=Cvel_454 / organism=Chromera_velia_CCMP2878 / gene_product=hypothetical protein / transcript_product=hypothetical protein / location=Cvel_scaffold14:185100-185741(-) / protein_length=214 / sequence_SO=supercontig / SO=protein_coding / is_pseudo=false